MYQTPRQLGPLLSFGWFVVCIRLVQAIVRTYPEREMLGELPYWKRKSR